MIEEPRNFGIVLISAGEHTSRLKVSELNAFIVLPLEGPAATVAAPIPLTGLTVSGRKDKRQNKKYTS